MRNEIKGRWIWMFLFVCFGVLEQAGEVDAASQIEYDYIVTDSQYKVDPTDKVSDIEGIQSVLDKAIGSEKMVTVYFPAGDYYVDKTIKVYSNTHIILDDKAVIHRMDSLIDNGLLYNVDQNGKRNVVGGYDMSENIILEGGVWDGGNTKLAKKGTDVIRIDHAKNITIQNCVMKNTYDCHILELVGVKNGLVRACTFTGFRYKKGKEKNYTYAREAIQLETAWTSNEKNLKDVNSAWAKGSVIDGTSCQQVTVTECKFIDTPCGVGQHRYTKSGKYRNKNITISNNTFDCSTKLKYCKIAITCCGTNGLNIYDNVVKGPYRFAMHVLASDDVTIERNQIKGISMNGIMVDKGKVTAIRENSLSNIGKHGISVGGGSIKDISKNVIDGTKQNGICVDDGTVTGITENVIKNVSKHGISIAKGKKITVKKISNNTISAAKQNGICVDAGKITNITGNTIKNVKRHGISIVGGTIGTGKKSTNGIQSNTIHTCKQNGISVSGKGKVSSIGKNKITNVKNNGISLTEKARVYWIVKNNIKKCKKHGIWNGINTVKVKIKGNKGKTK
ncbi:MAG: right-handed parallel beta-helix repeat-containing protein [Clostridium sp.]|nr:right-handed parallel beta-helix repeat-containing protein [Clostridium sp.]